MHVVLPEVDGRLLAGVVSFKSPGKRDPDLQFSSFAHRADADRIAAVVARVKAWVDLAATPMAKRKLALILSTYPGRAHQMAHAVGLDALASTQAVLADLAAAGYAIPDHSLSADALQTTHAAWPVADYLQALNKPILAGWPSGHGRPNLPLPLGLSLQMDVMQRQLTLI